jgi:protein-disulfide isomerase
MKSLTAGSLAALALTLAGCGDEGSGNGAASAPAKNVPLQQIAAPNGDWTQVVTQTPEGGFMMGNPNAPVKVVEFGSMTCGACAAFSQEGEPQLVQKYVKSGQVSFEFRNFVRDAADIAAALLARCNGPSAFFPLTDQLFAAQREWLGKLQELPPEQLQQMQTAGPQAAPIAFQGAGLDQFARLRGIPAAKAQACVSDQAQLQRLVDMGQSAVREFNVSGTPTFLVNGRVSDAGADWAKLESEIQAALQ